jgi:ABC-type transporter Mla maintaining outer membrane lipid asymmetry permease subunit MlaE
MKIIDQFNDLYVFKTNLMRFLAASRFLACFFMIPGISYGKIAEIIGICSGM